MPRTYKLNYNKTTVHPLQESGENLPPPYSYSTTPESWPEGTTFFSEEDVVIDAGDAWHKDYQPQ